MKKNIPLLLSVISTVLGILCLLSRHWYLSSAVDETGLLTPHAGNMASWILTAAAIAVCLLLVLTRRPRFHFEDTPLIYGSTVAYTLSLGTVAGHLLAGNSLLDIIAGMLALAAALSVVLQTVCRLSGKPVPVFSRFSLILFYLFFLLSAYQHWSTQPQTTLYVFQLLALVCLTIAAYQRAALALHCGNFAVYLICAKLAVFFCLAAVPGERNWLFYLFMAPAVVLDVEKCRQEA